MYAVFWDYFSIEFRTTKTENSKAKTMPQTPKQCCVDKMQPLRPCIGVSTNFGLHKRRCRHPHNPISFSFFSNASKCRPDVVRSANGASLLLAQASTP